MAALVKLPKRATVAKARVCRRLDIHIKMHITAIQRIYLKYELSNDEMLTSFSAKPFIEGGSHVSALAVARSARVDMTLTFFICVALVCFAIMNRSGVTRTRLWIFYAALAAATALQLLRPCAR